MKNNEKDFKEINDLIDNIKSSLYLQAINVLLNKIEEGKDIDRLDIMMIETLLEEYKELLLKSDDKND